MSTLCPPAAAISSARRASAWPWTSAKSPSNVALAAADGGDRRGGAQNPVGSFSAPTASASDRTGKSWTR